MFGLGMIKMKIMNKEIDFDDLFRRILALPPKDEEWYTFCVPKKELLKKGWGGKPKKVEIIVNEDMIILKRVKEKNLKEIKT